MANAPSEHEDAPRERPAGDGDVWATAIIVALLVAIPLGAIVRGTTDDDWLALLATMATILIVAPLAHRLRRG